MHLKRLSGIWRLFCLGLNVLSDISYLKWNTAKINSHDISPHSTHSLPRELLSRTVPLDGIPVIILCSVIAAKVPEACHVILACLLILLHLVPLGSCLVLIGSGSCIVMVTLRCHIVVICGIIYVLRRHKKTSCTNCTIQWTLIIHCTIIFNGTPPKNTSLSGLNSLWPGRFYWNFRWVLFKPIAVIDGWDTCCQIALRRMSLDLTGDKSTLVQVMAWCHQATSHYLNQCWPRSLSPYGVTRPNELNEKWSCTENFSCRLNRKFHLKSQQCCSGLNELTHWGIDAIRQGFLSSLIQVMVCWLTAPSHYADLFTLKVISELNFNKYVSCLSHTNTHWF